MKITFRLMVWESGPLKRAFKSSPALELYEEYLGRIGKFSESGSAAKITAGEKKKPGLHRWICDRGAGARLLSSEDLAARLDTALLGGVRELEIVIGGPDGFSRPQMEALQPDLRWSFGPFTLPHELAAVVAAEQVYRSWTILRNLPYHAGH